MSMVVPSGNSPYDAAPMFLSSLSSLSCSLGSRLVVVPIRKGMPNISPNMSQKLDMFFFGMVCRAHLRYSPRSCVPPASVTHHDTGPLR